MSEAIFLYTVKPRRTIVGLSGSCKVLRTNKSLYLTKEDVYLCLKNATVYRRFANEGINERVTIDDVERVHREEYIPADKWAEFLAKEASKGHGTVVVEDPKENEKEESVEPVENKEQVSEDKEESDQKEESVEQENESNEESTLPVNGTVEEAADTEDSDDEEEAAVESDDDLEIEKAE